MIPRAAVIAAVSVLSLLTLFGCTRPPQPPLERVDVIEPAQLIPVDVTVEVNDRSLQVAWRTEGKALISGYNIYISRVPLAAGNDQAWAAALHNATTFAGDTNPEDSVEQYEADGLQNGVPYYVSVRTVYPDRTLSPPSPPLRAVCGPRGEIELSVRYQSERDGFSFDGNDYVRADSSENDLYFFSGDARDYLSSPSHLDGWLRQSRFAVLDVQGDLAQAQMAMSRLESPPNAERVAIAPGNWVWVRTAGGGDALVKVLALTGQGTERRVRLFFAYVPKVDEST